MSALFAIIAPLFYLVRMYSNEFGFHFGNYQVARSAGRSYQDVSMHGYRLKYAL